MPKKTDPTTTGKDPTRTVNRTKKTKTPSKISETPSGDILPVNKEYRNNLMTVEGLDIPDGDNNRITKIGLEIFLLPKVDLFDPEAVKTRVVEYMDIYARHDAKPTLNGFANALGIDRRRLWEIATGNFRHPGSALAKLPKETADTISKIYQFLAESWENYILTNKVNVVGAIFLGKNHFGYQDRSEHVVTTANDDSPALSAADIASRYEDNSLELDSDDSDS